MTLWSMFGNDYRKNCLAWRHSSKNPAVPAAGQTWKSVWTANPDVLDFAGKTLLFYRGNGVIAQVVASQPQTGPDVT